MINPRYAKKSHMESMAVDTFAELRGRPLDILCVTLCVRACIVSLWFCPSVRIAFCLSVIQYLYEIDILAGSQCCCL